jgi:hypothetical protein
MRTPIVIFLSSLATLVLAPACGSSGGGSDESVSSTSQALHSRHPDAGAGSSSGGSTSGSGSSGGSSAGSCTGCIDASGTCQAGTSSDACGSNGNACSACGNAVCAAGFTDGNTCFCSTCTDSQGNCLPESACPPPGASIGCNDGCVLEDTCQPGTSTQACGSDGNYCAVCPAGQLCVGGACAPQTCFGCLDASGNCQPGTSVSACGSGQNSCGTCGANEICETLQQYPSYPYPADAAPQTIGGECACNGCIEYGTGDCLPTATTNAACGYVLGSNYCGPACAAGQNCVDPGGNGNPTCQ